MANAGSNQTVQTGATVTLDGSGAVIRAEDADLSVVADRRAGVTLSSSTAVQPTFTAPSRPRR